MIRELLPLLEPGDIVTHLFTANPGGVLDTNGKLVPEAKELAARGVWLDTAHGRMNFGFNVGRRVLDQGLIATLHQHRPDRSRAAPTPCTAWSRSWRASSGWASRSSRSSPCPPSIPRARSARPARLGSLAVGRQADISVLEVRDGRWVVYDTLRDSMKIDKTVVPVLTVKRGRVFEPEWGPHPWGWEPERVG